MTNREEIERRRTFAIISHPDAGKTTLTEKLLLYGGAINQAGSVKGKQSAKHAVSDWMDIEKQRGISVTSSVLQFNYAGKCVNILDTPGHQDFSEDTYRTLMAADSAVMVIDAAKGVEAQTAIFGEHMKEAWKKGHINRWLAANCFGDFYTRTGLDLPQREMITFCFLMAQGGCEPQLIAHAKGNMNLGNDKDFLVRVVSQCLPYIGYPRSLNAVSVLDKC